MMSLNSRTLVSSSGAPYQRSNTAISQSAYGFAVLSAERPGGGVVHGGTGSQESRPPTVAA